MRARAAYIRSLGTTSILVAAALLMLGVVGALVGFHGWPAGAVGRTVPSVPLKPTPQPVLSAVRDVRKAPARSTRLRRGGSTAGLVKVPVSRPHQVGAPVAVQPGVVVPTSGGPYQAPAPAAQQRDPEPSHSVAPAAPAPPATPDPQGIPTLVTDVIGSVPPPPAAPDDGQGLGIGVPLLGTVTLP